jgi:hypothetical protein
MINEYYIIDDDEKLGKFLEIFELFDEIQLILDILEFDIHNLMFNITKELENLQT